MSHDPHDDDGAGCARLDDVAEGLDVVAVRQRALMLVHSKDILKGRAGQAGPGSGWGGAN